MIDRKYLVIISIIGLFLLIAVFYSQFTEGETKYGTAPAYDSGWIDITAEAGQYITVLHNLNSTDIVVDITGKTTVNGGVHQRNLGGTSYTQGWSKTYGGASSDEAMSMVQTTDGGYTIAGHTKSYGAGGSDFWLIRTDSYGNLLWNRTYGGSGLDYGSSMVQTDDGGFAVAGYTKSYGAGDYDFWLVKTDSSGNALWNRTYGGAGSDQAHSLVKASDGGYVIAGGTESFGAGSQDLWLVKTDVNGNLEWNQTYGGTGWECGMCVIKTTDGGYTITGGSKPVGVDWSDFWLVKTDSAGNVMWNKTYGGPSDEFAYSLVQTVDGGYAIAGKTGYDDDSPDYDFWLVKTDADGNMKWNKTYGRTDNDRAYSILQTSDGGYALVGRSHFWGVERADSADIWFIKVDWSGDAQWNKTYGGANWDWAWSFVQTSDGGYTIAAYTESFGAGDHDFWLIKTDVEPGLAWTDSTADSITLYRGATDAYWNYVRVRIWETNEPI